VKKSPAEHQIKIIVPMQVTPHRTPKEEMKEDHNALSSLPSSSPSSAPNSEPVSHSPSVDFASDLPADPPAASPAAKSMVDLKKMFGALPIMGRMSVRKKKAVSDATTPPSDSHGTSNDQPTTTMGRILSIRLNPLPTSNRRENTRL
jgi:hypothetical protein